MYKISYSNDFGKSIGHLTPLIQEKITQLLDLLTNDVEYLLSESVEQGGGEYIYKINAYYRLIFSIKDENILLEEIRDLSDDLPNIEVVKIKYKLPLKFIIIFSVLGGLIITVIAYLIRRSSLFIP